MLRTILFLLASAAMALEVPVLPPPMVKLPPGEQPIALQRFDLSARVRGVLAEVTTTLVLANPNPRQLSGELEFPLPDGAVVCGYALDVGGRMVEGVIVTQDQARVVLETESRRRVDPGLVEAVRGNAFRTRIFPLPPGGTRTVAITWTTPLSVRGNEAALRLPLPRVALPQLHLAVEISVPGVEPQLGGFGDLRLTRWQGGQRAEATLSDVTPGDDLLVRLPNLPPVLAQIEERNGERFALISALPDVVQRDPALPRRLAVAWDASGSTTAAGAQRGRALLAALFAAAPGLTIDLVAFDLVPRAPVVFTDAASLDAHLAALPCDGASGLAALDLRRAALPHPADQAWLLISDGLGTWGEGLPAGGDVRVVCAMSEANRDEAFLRLVAARSGGTVLDLTTTAPAAAVQAIVNGSGTFQRVDAAPGVLGDIHSVSRGGRTLVLARLLGDGEAVLHWRNLPPVRVAMRSADVVPGTTVARAWAGARAADLAVFPDANRGELLALGRTYGVVTAGTSLLVLESLDQYLRHGVEPPASLPDLRNAWLAQVKNRAQADEHRAQVHHERLCQWWSERVRWWEGREARPEPAKVMGGVPPAAPRLAVDAAAVTVPEDVIEAGEERDDVPREREAAVAEAEMGNQGAFMSIGAGGGDAKRARGFSGGPSATTGAITIAAWNPATPWLATLRTAGPGRAYAAWLAQRSQLIGNPSAILDCAGLVLGEDRGQGVRLLSNLAELRLDDPALLRVLAWRLQDAGETDAAIAVLRRVLRLRPEEPQSYRDLALALAVRFDRSRTAADAGEALGLLARVFERRPLEDRELGERWTIDANWDRFPRCEVIALEEFNRLAARCAGSGATVPVVDSRRRANLDCDLRIAMSWDADATDIDLHVLQPDGETAFYGRSRTAAGGLVSPDCTQGYGPEEYLLRRAAAGDYRIHCKYFGSRQTGLLGPATVTATVYLDWGRPSERSQRLTLRLDRTGDTIPVGTATVGANDPAAVKTGQVAPAARALDRQAVAGLRLGLTRAEVERRLGRPERIDADGIAVLVYRLAGGNPLRIGFGPDLLWAREISDGAERDLLR
jgi:Ca-activated chloride channel family protein